MGWGELFWCWCLCCVQCSCSIFLVAERECCVVIMNHVCSMLLSRVKLHDKGFMHSYFIGYPVPVIIL